MPTQSAIQPSPSEIAASQISAPALSPTSSVKGKGFDRIAQIWLENTDYDLAVSDPDMKWLAAQGITLSNYWAVTHPSQPNYCASVAGDYFGLDSDDFVTVPANVSTVVDLLDTKGISWGEYQEDMPYAGFLGGGYSTTSKNDYVRKHNPLVSFDSVSSNRTRLALLKNFTSFDSDLREQKLPQWSFITPNMTNDGHDTSLPFASKWARGFLRPLLENSYFMNNTLLVLTFDENHNYALPNRVFTLLLGGAIPSPLRGTVDSTFYTHYSALASVEANWGLPSLGRWDCGANIFALVANKTGYVNQAVDTSNLHLNASYPGPLNSKKYVPVWSIPNTRAKCSAGNGVLDAVVRTWGKEDARVNYTAPYPSDDKMGGTTTGGTPNGPSGSPAANPSHTGTGVRNARRVDSIFAVGVALGCVVLIMGVS